MSVEVKLSQEEIFVAVEVVVDMRIVPFVLDLKFRRFVWSASDRIQVLLKLIKLNEIEEKFDRDLVKI